MTKNILDRYTGFNNMISADFLRDEAKNLRWHIARVQELLYIAKSCDEDVRNLEMQLKEATEMLRQIEAFLKRVENKEAETCGEQNETTEC